MRFIKYTVGFEWLVALGFALRAGLWLSRIRAAPVLRAPVLDTLPSMSDPRVAVIVPILHEHNRLPGLVGHLAKLRADGENFILIVVTTTRDTSTVEGLSMTDVVAGLVRKYGSDWVVPHHTDDPGGNMATQLNAAVSGCLALDDSDVLAIYNADSRPVVGSFATAARMINQAGRDIVVQQHAVYLRNLADLRRRNLISRGILIAAAAWQTRWSMGFEQFHAVRNALGNSEKRPFSYVIGHGMFVRRSVLRGIGGFTEKFPNEDAHLSLRLVQYDIPIHPHPLLEVSDSPDTVRGLFVQKRVWFMGPARAGAYHEDISEGQTGSDREPLARAARSLFSHAVCWLAGPTFATLAVGLALMGRRRVGALRVGAAVLIYTAALNDVGLTQSHHVADVDPGLADRVAAALGAVPAYLLHGLAAYRGSIALILHRLWGRPVSKPRTPMRSGAPA